MRSGQTKSQSGFLALVIVLMGMMASGCVPHYTDYEAFMRKPRPIVGGKPYILEPPDSVTIVAPGAPEIDGQGGAIRPDGYITLHLLGDVFAAGKTPAQLGAEIEEGILKYYQDVSVQVRVGGFGSKQFYMAGEITGARAYTGTNTLFSAMISGGIPRTAWPEKVVLLRPNEHGDLIRRMSVNVLDIIRKGDLTYNALLEEGDIIYVPLNPIATLGVVVQMIMSPVQPVASALRAPNTIENTFN